MSQYLKGLVKTGSGNGLVPSGNDELSQNQIPAEY